MKGKNRYKILSLFLVVLAGTILIGWADTLEQIKKNKVEIETIRADFVQEKHMKILSNPFVSKGVFYHKIPNSFRWEYCSPIISIMLMHKGCIVKIGTPEEIFQPVLLSDVYGTALSVYPHHKTGKPTVWPD